MNAIRPGGILHERPVSLSEKDKEYSRAFWDAGQPKGLKDAMENIIFHAASKEGTFSTFVGFDKEKGKFEETSKRKLSAYRELAFQHGILMGGFVLNESAGTVTAQMFRLHEVVDHV